MTQRRGILLMVTVATLGVGVASAQIVVTDPATTARNAITAAVKSLIVDIVTQQLQTLERMAERLSAHTTLDKYAPVGLPPWLTHDVEADSTTASTAYGAALDHGDPTGAAYGAIARQRGAVDDMLARLASPAQDALARQLATLDLADSTLVAATHQTGLVRANGRLETQLLDALARDVIDPSPAQSATAILDKISGARLIETQQKHARLQLLTALVEQLIVDNKRARDTESAALNMQLGRLRAAGARGDADPLLAGAGDDLRTWRQP